MTDFWMILAIAGAAALASPLGGFLAVWRKPTTLAMSIALGLAAGTLLGAISFKMVPDALDNSPLAVVAGCVGIGFLAIYAFDLYVNRGRVAGDDAEQRLRVRRFHRRHPPRGDKVTVLAGGTSAEEIVEGLSIGVGAGLDPGLAILIGAAIAVDNVTESLGIGELAQAQHQGRKSPAWRIIKWTGLIGVSLFASAMAGWYFLRDLPPQMLGAMLAVGAGSMLYLTVTDLLPEGEKRHYQQSSALALGAGFLMSLILSRLA